MSYGCRCDYCGEWITPGAIGHIRIKLRFAWQPWQHGRRLLDYHQRCWSDMNDRPKEREK